MDWTCMWIVHFSALWLLLAGTLKTELTKASLRAHGRDSEFHSSMSCDLVIIGVP